MRLRLRARYDASARREDVREPEKTWPPLPAAEPDETAVAEEEAEAVRAEGGVARPGDEELVRMTPNGGRRGAGRRRSVVLDVWAAIARRRGRRPGAAASPTTKRSCVTGVSVERTTETVSFSRVTRAARRSSTRGDHPGTTRSANASARARRDGGRRGAAARTRRRLWKAPVRAAVDARAAAAVFSSIAARAMDEKMASSARTLLGEGEGREEENGEEEKWREPIPRETTARGEPGWRFFDFEECFAPETRVPEDSDTAHIPRVCRWRSAHGSSFVLAPALRDAAAGVENPY